MGFSFVIYLFLSNNPSSGDINSSNLPCLIWIFSLCGVMPLLKGHNEIL